MERDIQRKVAPQKLERRTLPPTGPAQFALLLGLQRAAGNRAVSELAQQQGDAPNNEQAEVAPGPPLTPETAAKVIPGALQQTVDEVPNLAALLRIGPLRPVVSRQDTGTTNPARPATQSGLEAETHDIIYEIVSIQMPSDVAEFWASNCRTRPAGWAGPLSELEQGYVSAFRDTSTPEALRMRAPPQADQLNAEELGACRRIFGGQTAAAREAYANYETRRRIVAHYVYTHPATVALELGIFRLFRDVNPIHFALERGWQIGSGREMFTGTDTSRLGAAAEFLLAVGLVYGIGRAVGAARPSASGSSTSRVPLESPIYDLPTQGGGLRINGRWYTEHALERMAPNTPAVRAQLRSRAGARLERLGIRPGHPAYDATLRRALQRIDPRGVPPSVVEAEIVRPGSTNVRVITANRKQVVVTVMPR